MLDIDIKFNSDGQYYISKSERTWEPRQQTIKKRLEVLKGLSKGEYYLFFCLVRHNPYWKKIAQDEINKALSCMNRYTWIKDVQHIGSTSIPGMDAKPMIDIMIGYDAYDSSINEASVEEFLYLLGFHKYENSGSFFVKKDFGFGVSMHVVPYKCPLWNAKVLFRDYLREHPIDAKRYEFVKNSLMEQKLEYADYVAGKVPLIREFLEKAGATEEEIKAACG